MRREPDEHGSTHFIDAIVAGRSYASIAEEFLACEEFRYSAAVKLFVPPGHFYSPIVDPIEADRHLTSKAVHPTPASLPGIAIDQAEMIRIWQALLPSLSSIPFPGQQAPGFRYYFDNPAYSWGDGSVLHAMLRFHRPKRLIEIGSGWSSACTLDTIDRYLEGACDLTFIDPYPQLLREVLGDATGRVRVLEMPVQEVPPQVFDALEAGDILFCGFFSYRADRQRCMLRAL